MVVDLINRIKSVDRLFLLTVIVPTLLSIVYFGFLASDVYISESRFVVRSAGKSESVGLSALLKSATISSGFSTASSEVHAVQTYAASRDALRELNKNDYIKNIYRHHKVNIFDRFNPVGYDGSFEALYRYYGGKVSIEYDTTTAVTGLVVRAYAPADAYHINNRLLELSEALVNRLNERGRQDLIRFATAEVEDAERQARNAAFALSAYRNKEGLVDPEQQASLQLQLVSKLQDELISTRAQLRQLRAFTPDNPQIAVLESRAEGLRREVAVETGKIAGDNGSLAGAAARYQRLLLDSRFADQMLAGAMASLEQARNEARRKQVYLDRVVQPNLPDEALEPRRLRSIAATFVLGLVAWGILTMLLAGVREHRD
ncbi:hypothetical protein [Sphingomonas fennica]|uniref:Capsule biosynthesis protein n=1 Tax=Edaphosphingomonas fennica TaxID=114404 RepID=A0A2T4HLS2_9SPHN|nr:hypothetical protein [Sphingomonas fennica]PTD16750.1 hypothetical protein CV103_20225 [Sphingomonas fennica]